MGRFFFWFVLLLIAGGVTLHYKFVLPYVSGWLGTLPGDTIVTINGMAVFFPITSAAICSFVVSVVFSILSPSRSR